MPRFDDPQEDFRAQYFLALYEIKQRRFSFVERRLAEHLLDLTYGRDKSDVAIPSVQELADSIPCLRNNLVPVIERLESAQIIGRDEARRTWWLNEIDLWQRLECLDGSDPNCAQSAVAATARIIAFDQQRARQREMFPEVTAAEVQAEAGRARAAEWLATDLPPNVGGPTSGSSIKKTNDGADRLKNRRIDEDSSFKKTNEEAIRLKNRRSASYLPASAPACVRPGYQEILLPGKPGQGGSGGIRRGFVLGDADRRLLTELEEYAGPQSAEERANWSWRIRYKGSVVERAMREVQAVEREGRELVRSRYGYIKKLFREWSGEAGASQPAPTPPPSPPEQARVAPAPAARMKTVAVRTAAQEAEDAEREQRFNADLQRWKEQQKRALNPEVGKS